MQLAQSTSTIILEYVILLLFSFYDPSVTKIIHGIIQRKHVSFRCNRNNDDSSFKNRRLKAVTLVVFMKIHPDKSSSVHALDYQ